MEQQRNSENLSRTQRASDNHQRQSLTRHSDWIGSCTVSLHITYIILDLHINNPIVWLGVKLCDYILTLARFSTSGFHGRGDHRRRFQFPCPLIRRLCQALGSRRHGCRSSCGSCCIATAVSCRPVCNCPRPYGSNLPTKGHTHTRSFYAKSRCVTCRPLLSHVGNRLLPT